MPRLPRAPKIDPQTFLKGILVNPVVFDEFRGRSTRND